ncbi:glycosyltransferase family 4 protein [Halomonas piscis]|uniref:Glycosyltransferase family 4 protein n=1 Tax=Halomonas piscis TaxID=3031727 RepID=A0ABY9Z4B3_9GAMM|nr:glycosyltransferase family 4 protein [Halomonas piscis]WNK21199.1 glycosyltransferase family 4 protein [Halomonas piscis]
MSHRFASINVVIINDFAHVQGGAAKVAIESAIGLAEAGHRVFFIYGDGPASEALFHPNIQLIDLEEQELLNNPSRFLAAREGLWNRRVASRVAEVLRGLSAEHTVVHLHSWVKVLSPSVIHAIRRAGLPLVTTLHDYFSVCPNGGFYNYRTQSTCPLRPLSAACLATNCDARSYPQKIWRSARQFLTSMAGMPRHQRHFIYVSEFSRRVVEPYLPKAANLWHVPNPIKANKEEPVLPSRSTTMSFIGRLTPEKGGDVFVEAARLTGIHAKLVGAGSMQDTLEARLPDAQFTGWQPHAAVIDHMKTSRCVVLSSRIYETQGMVVAEAAAYGVPSIVSSDCAGSEFIEDGVTGLLFRSGDINDLAEKMRRLANDDALVNRLGKQAYARFWEADLTAQRHVDNLMTCYRHMLATQR